MITKIILKDFKSYGEAELPLAPLSLFVGPNASGKSNALEAIRLLSWLARGSRLDDIERGIQGSDFLVRGQASNLFRYDTQRFAIECHISEAPEDWGIFSLEIGLINDQLIVVGESVSSPSQEIPLYRVEGEPNPHTDEISVMYNNFKRGRNKPHIPCSNRQAVFYQLETPGRFDKHHEKSQRIVPAVTKKLREAFRRIVFLDPKPSLMRDYSYEKDSDMKEDGSNLSSVLYRVWNDKNLLSGRPLSEHLLDFVKSLPEQDITDVRFIRTERRDVMVRLVESFGNEMRTVDAPLLSDGTLRVLGVAGALLTAPRGALVVIEEIDNGVHPSRADRLVGQIESISRERGLRVLLTSHNPALLDALPDESLGDVLCCYRDPDTGHSRIVQLRQLEQYPELVATGPLGSLMSRGILERFVKDKRTAEARKASKLAWLESLRAEEASE